MADVAAWYLALGAVALVALRRESWRIPVIALASVQYALHSLNHLIDVGEADPGLARSANLVSLALTTILLGAIAGHRCGRRARRAGVYKIVDDARAGARVRDAPR